MRIPRSLSSSSTVYPFKRTVSGILTLNPSTGFGSGANFSYGLGFSSTLNQLVMRVGAATVNLGVPSSTDFQNLFDQWRVAKVVLKFAYSNNVSTSASGTTFLPMIMYAPDHDDDVAPSSETELLQRPEHKLVQLGSNGNTNNIREFTVYPNIAVAAYQGTLTAFADASRKTWCDIAYPDIRYYGQKLWWSVERSTNVDIGSFHIFADIYYEFRGVR